MKKKLFKKVQAGLLTMVLIAGVLLTGLRPLTVQAADTVKTINLDTSCLAPSDNTWDKTNDHKVYFGQYGNTPTAFRVLKSDNGTIMLDCDTILLTKAFDADVSANTDQSDSNPNGWVNSDLESWLNGTDYYSNASVFTSVERSAIASTGLAASESDYSAGYGTYKDYAATNYVYLLSANEANTLYADDTARKKQAATTLGGCGRLSLITMTLPAS